MASEPAEPAAPEATSETPAQPEPQIGSEQAEPEKEQPVIIYRCPQCRVGLFKSTSIIPHQATKERKFARKRQEYAGVDSECTSFFIEKPGWLDATGRKADSIKCPRCGFKVGHFNWIGCQCSCGEWVKPSFQIPKSRVDAC